MHRHKKENIDLTDKINILDTRSYGFQNNFCKTTIFLKSLLFPF